MAGSAFSFSLDDNSSEVGRSSTALVTSKKISQIDFFSGHDSSAMALWSGLGTSLLLVSYLLASFQGVLFSSSAILAIHIAAILTGSTSAWFGLRDLASDAVADLRKLHLTASGLCVIGTASLLIAALVSFAETSQSEVLWSSSESFALSASLLSLWLYTKNRLERWLVSDSPNPFAISEIEVTILEGGSSLEEKKLLSSKLESGMVLRLSEGQKVAADCLILEGLLEVQEKRLTGASQFRMKGKGDTIFAGSIVVQGKADCKVQSAPAESFITTFQEKLYANLQGLHDLNAELSSSFESRASLIILFSAAIASVFWLGSGKGTYYSFAVFGGTVSVGVLLLTISWIPLFYRHLLFSAFNKGVIFDQFLPSVKNLANSDSFAIDFHSKDNFGESQVALFEVIDERIDSSALKSVLVSILGRSTNPSHIMIGQFLRKEMTTFSMHEIEAISVVQDPDSSLAGIIASVQGVPFVMGSETFLVTSGVQVLVSEVGKIEPENSYFFIAMNGEIVAKVALAKPFTADGVELVEGLKEQKMRVILMGEEDSPLVQPVAGEIGIDLADTFSSMSPGSRIERLKAMAPVAMLANNSTPSTVTDAATVAFRAFDEYKWSVNTGEVTLVHASLNVIPWLLNASGRMESMFAFRMKFIPALLLPLVLSQMAGVVEPSVAIGIAVIGSCYLFFKRS